MTEIELRTIVDASHDDGVIESTEREMINNVFDFGDSLAKDIMVPRIDMVCIGKDDSYEEILSVFKKEKYTRIPVYEDSQDNVIGILNVKDLLLSDNTSEFNVVDIMREPYFVPETKACGELFKEMRLKRIQMAVVVDEYGGTAGLVSMEDLIESVMGNIQDEYDNEAEEISAIDEDNFDFEGTVLLDDIEELLDIEVDEDADYDTLSGLIMDILGRIPEEDEHPVVEYQGVEFTVVHVEEHRIAKVHAKILPKEEEED